MPGYEAKLRLEVAPDLRARVDMRSQVMMLTALALLTSCLRAQDLAPRAYLITPLHSNAVTLTWSLYDGGIDVNGMVPVTGATGTYNVPAVSYYHSFNFFGRSANVTAALPYGAGNFTGNLVGQDVAAYRSGLLDCSVRMAVNLFGGPAMELQPFTKWRKGKILGASVKVIVPTGQYDPNRRLNWGSNRWAFKTELGYSQRWGNWVLDGYGGVWFYTENPAFSNIPAPQPQSQSPVGSFEGHLSYDLPRFKGLKSLGAWASLDGNFWWGGIRTLGGTTVPDTKQTSSRLGATVSVPFTNHQSVKISYSGGTYVRVGGNYQNLQVAWQYSWLGWPK